MIAPSITSPKKQIPSSHAKDPFKPTASSVRRFPAGRFGPRGFTLTELLVTIAIIAVLAAIVVVITGRVKNRAYEMHAMQNLRQIHLGTMSFEAENGSRFPAVLFDLQEDGTPGGPWGNLWVHQLEPHMPNAHEHVAHQEGRNAAFYCPKVNPINYPQRRWIADYAPNDNLMQINAFRSSLIVREPAKELLFYEAAKNLNEDVTPYNSGGFKAWTKKLAVGDFDYPNTVARRHGSKSDPAFYGIFVDGHVERFKLNKLKKDDERWQTLFSANQSGNSIYGNR